MPTFRVYPIGDKAQTGVWQSTEPNFCSALDDDPSDEDVTYIQGGGDITQNRTQKFTMSTLGLPPGTLLTSVSFLARAKRFDDGQNVFSFALKMHIDIGDLRYLLASASIPAPSAYQDITAVATTNPATGFAWTPEDVARLLVVVEVAQTFDNLPRVGAFGRFTQIYADVAFTKPTWTVRGDAGGALR